MNGMQRASTIRLRLLLRAFIRHLQDWMDYKQIALPRRIYNLILMDWQAKLQAEFDRAEQARANRNEGQARVCARRAAGIAIREYFTRKGTAAPSASAVD